MRKIYLVGGGTGGHCLPMLTTYRFFKKKKIECKIITDERGRVFFDTIPEEDKKILKNLFKANNRVSQIFNIPLFYIKSLFIFLNSKADFVVGFGGYMTLAPLYAAKILNYKIAIHEANAVMGKANRNLVSKAKIIFTTFEQTLKIENKFRAKVINVGMPVRDLKNDKRIISKNIDKIRICVIGGSQGSKSLSEIVPKAIVQLQDKVSKKIHVSHQGRLEDLKKIKNFYIANKLSCEVSDYFDDMTTLIHMSDIIISRSGSSTTNEIINAKKPSILIPFPYAVDDHQYFNAKKLSEIKCSKVIRNENLNSVNLSLEAYRLLYFEKNSGYIRSKLSRIKTTNSSEQILSKLYEYK